MFEHLCNDAENFRNKVIFINNHMESITNLMKNYSDSGLLVKRSIMRDFLKVQDELNNLYRYEIPS